LNTYVFVITPTTSVIVSSLVSIGPFSANRSPGSSSPVCRGSEKLSSRTPVSVSSRSKKPVIQARLLGFSSSQDTKTRRRPTRRPARIILVRFRGCRPASIQLRLGLLDHPAQSPYELGQLIAQDSVAFPRQPNQPTTVVERPKELNIA